MCVSQYVTSGEPLSEFLCNFKLGIHTRIRQYIPFCLKIRQQLATEIKIYMLFFLHPKD